MTRCDSQNLVQLKALYVEWMEQFNEATQSLPVSLQEQFEQRYETVALQAIKERPGDPRPLFLLAWGYHFFQDNFELAEYSYMGAIRAEKGNESNYSPALTYLYWQKGEIDNAIKTWQTRNHGWGQDIFEWFGPCQWWKVDFPSMFDSLFDPQLQIDAYFNHGLNTSGSGRLHHGLAYLLKAQRIAEQHESDLGADSILPLVRINILSEFAWRLETIAERTERSAVIPKLKNQWEQHLDEYSTHIASIKSFIKAKLLDSHPEMRETADDLMRFFQREEAIYSSLIYFLKKEQDYALFEQLANWYERSDTYKGDVEDAYGSALATILNHRPEYITEKAVFTLIKRTRDVGLWRASDEKGSELLHTAGTILFNQGEYIAAEEWFQDAHIAAPSNREIVHSLAKVQIRNQKLDQVERLLQNQRPLTDYEESLLAIIASQKAESSREQAEERLLLAFSKFIPKQEQELRELVENRCRTDFASTWHAFPKHLQDHIVDSELEYERISSLKQSSYGTLITIYAILCEAALKSVFSLDLLQQLADRNQTPLPSEYRELTLGKMATLLRNSKGKGSMEPFAQLIREYTLSWAAWQYRIPDLISEINAPRNEAVHNALSFDLEHAKKIRSILYTGGLLVEVGKALIKIAAKPRKSGDS